MDRNPGFWKSDEERLREWVSDEIPLQVGQSHIVFSRKTIVGLWQAILRGHSSYKARIGGAEHRITRDVFGGLQDWVTAHPKAYPDDFLCQFRTFYQAVCYVLPPPDTLLDMQRAEEERRKPQANASATKDTVQWL